MASRTSSIGAVLLAAGGSTRMGRPKPLIEIGGQPLVVRAAQALLETSVWPVVVVAGEAAPQIRAALARLPVLVVQNPSWKDGMSSSIRLGIAILHQFSRSLEAALLCLCDQPGFDAAAATALIEARARTRASIVAARYCGRLGAPALFAREHFLALGQLKGDQGARALLSTDTTVGVDLPALALDLDTPEDLRKFEAGI